MLLERWAASALDAERSGRAGHLSKDVGVCVRGCEGVQGVQGVQGCECVCEGVRRVCEGCV